MQQDRTDAATEARLEVMRMEAVYNCTRAKKLRETYGPGGTKSNVIRLDDTAGRLVLEDENLYHVLDVPHIHLIYAYVETVQLVNWTNDSYLELLALHGDAITAETHAQRRSNICLNSLEFLSWAAELMERFDSMQAATAPVTMEELQRAVDDQRASLLDQKPCE